MRTHRITREQCRVMMLRVMEDNGWQLVTNEEEFLDQVVAETNQRATRKGELSLEKIINNAIVNRYNHQWHWACRQHGAPIQNRAYRELYAHMYKIAMQLTKNDELLAQDCAQEAVVNVLKHIDDVQDPGAFQAWANVIIRRVTVRQLRKQNKKTSASKDNQPSPQPSRYVELSHPFDNEDADNLFYLHVQETISRHEPELRDEIRSELETAIRSCLRNKKQQEAIIRCLLDDKEHTVVAHELGVTPENLSVLKTRAIAKLRKCDKFKDTLNDLTQT